MSDRTEAEVIAEISREQTIHKDKALAAPFMVVSSRSGISSLESLMLKPTRVRATANLRSLGSFVDYLKRFAVSGSSIIKSDPKNAKFEAVIDYHSGPETPDWCDHIVKYNCEPSREWLAWKDRDGQSFKQEEFADFLEERAPDVVTPTGSELMEIALKFHVIRKAVFGKQIRLASGEIQFQYSEDNQKGTVEVPEEIVIAVAPFHNGETYKVKARFRYRLSEGSLHFSYHLTNPDNVVEHAFKEMVEKIESFQLGVPIFESVL